MWFIGSKKINSHVVLAPMAGITSLGYREFCKSFGVGYSVTEMVSDAGIVYHNKKTLDILKTSNLDRPVAIQLFGNQLKTTLKAIDIINKELHINYDFLDINLGCPVRKIIRSNAGSAWLQNTKKLYNYIFGIVQHSSKPVTAKIRLGLDYLHINFFEVVKTLIKAGVKAIAIHARTVKQKYSGKANYEILKDFGKKISIPLIVSGDIFTLNDAIRAQSITGATAIMVARGAVGNPNLIKQINQYFDSKIKLDDVKLTDNVNYCLKLAKKIIKEKGEKNGMLVFRKIAPLFFKNFLNAKKIRNELYSIKNYKDLCSILECVKKNYD